MDREHVQQIWDQHKSKTEPAIDYEAHVEKFAEALLFEAAKAMCVGCRMYGPSEYRGHMMRVHVVGGVSERDYSLTETCRAAMMYFDPRP